MNDLLDMFNKHLKIYSHRDPISGDHWIEEDDLNNSYGIDNIIKNYIIKRNNENKTGFPKNIDKLMELEYYDNISIYNGLINNGYKFNNNMIVIMFFYELFRKYLSENSNILDPKHIGKYKYYMCSNSIELYNIYEIMEHPEVKKYIDNEIIITDKDINKTVKLFSNSPEDNIDYILNYLYEINRINKILEGDTKKIKKVKWPKPVLKLEKYNEIIKNYEK